jgi:hypothetical protein
MKGADKFDTNPIESNSLQVQNHRGGFRHRTVHARRQLLSQTPVGRRQRLERRLHFRRSQLHRRRNRLRHLSRVK